jgi:hypothetical protein
MRCSLQIVALTLLFPVVAHCLPYPDPLPEPIFSCTGLLDPGCGSEGTCVVNSNRQEQTTQVIASKQHVETRQGTNASFVCKCSERYGNIKGDSKPCTRERTSKALAFWLQLFLGALGVGAFVLNWIWYGLSVYIALLLGCMCICTSCCCKEEDQETCMKTAGSCVSCILVFVILGMWIANFVYIIEACYSVVDVDGTGYAFKCWENL